MFISDAHSLLKQDTFWGNRCVCGMFSFFFICMCVSLMKFCWQDVFREISNGLLNQTSEKHWSQHQGVTPTWTQNTHTNPCICTCGDIHARGPHTNTHARVHVNDHTHTHTHRWSGGKELIIDIPMFLCEQSDCCHYLLIQLHTGKLQAWKKT